MPQDDWAVVEEALNLRTVIRGRPTGNVVMRDALAALARLREREAQLEGEREWIKERHGQQADRANAAEARVAELERDTELLTNTLQYTGEAANRFEARVAELTETAEYHQREAAKQFGFVKDLTARAARLEEALRLVHEAYRPYREDMVAIALEAVAAALAHEEETVQPWNRSDWPERSGL